MLKKILQKTILTLILVWSVFFVNHNIYAIAPSFNENYAQVIENKSNKADSEWRIESMYSRKVDYKENIKTNIENLFYPKPDWESQIRKIIRMLCFGFIFGYILYIGILFVKDAGESKEIEYMTKLMYAIIWAVIILVSTRIAQAIPINTGGGSAWLVEAVEGKIFFQILVIMKSMAFFIAIVMMLRYWYQAIMTVNKEDKLDIAKQWVLNIIIALMFIKIIDYIYFIAQNPDLKSQATNLIVEIIKILLYVVGAFFTFYILYAGFKLLTDRWEWEWIAHFKKVATWIFLGSALVFIFLLILYQIIGEFK